VFRTATAQERAQLTALKRKISSLKKKAAAPITRRPEPRRDLGDRVINRAALGYDSN
jgi:hypothetical protein